MGHRHLIHHFVPLTGQNLYYLPWESYIRCLLPLDGRLTKSTLGGTTVQHLTLRSTTVSMASPSSHREVGDQGAPLVATLHKYIYIRQSAEPISHSHANTHLYTRAHTHTHTHLYTCTRPLGQFMHQGEIHIFRVASFLYLGHSGLKWKRGLF